MTGFNRVLQRLVTRFPRRSPPSDPEPSIFEPSSLSVHACLFVGSARPPSSVTCRESFDCMLVTWPLDQPYACLSPHHLCTFTRRHPSFSNSHVSPPLRFPRTQHVALSEDPLSRRLAWPRLHSHRFRLVSCVFVLLTLPIGSASGLWPRPRPYTSIRSFFSPST